jgi:hypothetical protein
MKKKDNTQDTAQKQKSLQTAIDAKLKELGKINLNKHDQDLIDSMNFSDDSDDNNVSTSGDNAPTTENNDG